MSNFLKKYKDIYDRARTPREFINMLRNKYGEQYCFEVGSWLNGYMEFLKINIFDESKYENLLEKESEDDMKQKLVETIQKIKDENYEQVNYIRLKQLEESISQTDS